MLLAASTQQTDKVSSKNVSDIQTFTLIIILEKNELNINCKTQWSFRMILEKQEIFISAFAQSTNL